MRAVRGVIVVLALVLIGTVFLVCLKAQEAPTVAPTPSLESVTPSTFAGRDRHSLQHTNG
jgi:photosystem II stability/assembly factor-like uncharacterized protein